MRAVGAGVARLLMGLALAWSGLALGREVQGALALYDSRDANTLPLFWRFGMAPVERFSRCVAAARPLLPASSPTSNPPSRIVAFASAGGPADSGFYRWRWAAYLLPGHEVVPWSDPRARAQAGYLLTYRVQVSDPRLLQIARLPGGLLFQVRR